MLYRKKVGDVDEYRKGKLELVEGAPQVILMTATVTPAVRQLLDKPDQHFAPKKVSVSRARRTTRTTRTGRATRSR